jgi:hypothetical protein
VVIEGRSPLRAPIERPMFTGRYSVTLRSLGYDDLRETVVISDGQTAVLQATLQRPDPGPEPPPSPLIKTPEPPVGRRPLWRIVAGSVAIGVGGILTGFGASALAVDGSCVEPAIFPIEQCPDLFATRDKGIGLLVPGLALTVGGVILIALPPGRPSEKRLGLRPGGLGLHLAF